MVKTSCVVFFDTDVRGIVLIREREKLDRIEGLVSYDVKVVETRGGQMVVNARKRGLSQIAR
jgi:hypothetical protein